MGDFQQEGKNGERIFMVFKKNNKKKQIRRAKKRDVGLNRQVIVNHLSPSYYLF